MFERDRAVSRDRVGIVDAAYTLPGDPNDLRHWGVIHNVDKDRLAELERNHCRYFHEANGESDADLIVDAVTALSTWTCLDPRQVAYVVHAHTQPFSIPAAPHSLLSEVAGRLGLEPKMALSIGHLACAAVVQAIDLALDLLRSDPLAEYALVTTADRVFGGPAHRLRQNAGIQSDGASAILLGRMAIRAHVLTTHISAHANMHGGPAAPSESRFSGSLTWMHTRRALKALCDESGIAINELGGIFPNNADAPHWSTVTAQIGVDDGKLFLDNVRRRGHACCADFAVNLVDEGFSRIDMQGPILVFSQSNVGAYAGMLLHKGESACLA